VGDVRLGEDVSIWFGAVLRGDLAPVTVGKGSNVQDNSVLHVGDHSPCVVGQQTVVGHRAMLHGCGSRTAA
jgi:carbonic anhydrase/acetyltransferase-like protein (isoleucine patch superfamily)